jgi:hypothetical protein
VGFMGFAFGNAADMGFVKAIDLMFILKKDEMILWNSKIKILR